MHPYLIKTKLFFSKFKESDLDLDKEWKSFYNATKSRSYGNNPFMVYRIRIIECHIEYKMHLNEQMVHDRFNDVLRWIDGLCHRHPQRIPNIDFLIFIGDGVINQAAAFPIWMMESNKNPKFDGAPLFIPRSIIDYQKKSELSHISNMKTPAWWSRKNKAVFRGKVIYDPMYTNNVTDCRQILLNVSNARPDLLDAKSGSENYLTSAQQMMYKFIIIADGQGIPDRVPKNLLFDSVLIKAKSDKYAFWYCEWNPPLTFDCSDPLSLISTLEQAVSMNEDQCMVMIKANHELFEHNLNETALDEYLLQLMHLYQDKMPEIKMDVMTNDGQWIVFDASVINWMNARAEIQNLLVDTGAYALCSKYGLHHIDFTAIGYVLLICVILLVAFFMKRGTRRTRYSQISRSHND